MKELEAEIQALIQTDPDLTQRLKILISIPGLARQTASALLIGMPELAISTPSKLQAWPVWRP